MNVLYIDIETSPLLVYAWGIYNVNAIDVAEESRILGYSYAWNDAKVRWVDVEHAENRTRAIEYLWHLFDKADWIIAHNGDRFDIKKINLEFAREGMGPPSFYRSIDTKKVASAAFGHYSNSLKYLARTFHLDDKMQNSGFQLWLDYMANVPAARREMSAYARQDTETLRQLYLHIRGWAKAHPNAGHHADGAVCRVCASAALVKRGFKETNAGKYQQYRCSDCGAYSTSPYRESTPALR